MLLILHTDQIANTYKLDKRAQRALERSQQNILKSSLFSSLYVQQETPVRFKSKGLSFKM